MAEVLVILGWIGLYAPMALGAIGSIIGCAVAGQAAIGAMLDTETGHGRYVGVSAMPSSQVIYGIVVMFTLNRPITEANASGIFAVGVLAGLVVLSAAFAGTLGVTAFGAATLVGHLPPRFGCRRATLMGVLLVPIAL